jgi:hypothetical protein
VGNAVTWRDEWRDADPSVYRAYLIGQTTRAVEREPECKGREYQAVRRVAALAVDRALGDERRQKDGAR